MKYNNKSNFMVGVMSIVLKGHSIRKAENHYKKEMGTFQKKENKTCNFSRV